MDRGNTFTPRRSSTRGDRGVIEKTVGGENQFYSGVLGGVVFDAADVAFADVSWVGSFSRPFGTWGVFLELTQHFVLGYFHAAPSGLVIAGERTPS